MRQEDGKEEESILKSVVEDQFGKEGSTELEKKISLYSKLTSLNSLRATLVGS